MARIPILPAQARAAGVYQSAWVPLTEAQQAATMRLGHVIARSGWPAVTDNVVRILLETSEDGGVTVAENFEFTNNGLVPPGPGGAVVAMPQIHTGFYKTHPLTGAVIPFWPDYNPLRRIRVTTELFLPVTTSVDAELS